MKARVGWDPPDKKSTAFPRGSQWDKRGHPAIYIVCTGKGDGEHKETVVAKAVTPPFDPSKGEASEWHWDADVTVGGEPLHPVLRYRENKNRRKLTPEELDSIGGEEQHSEAWTNTDAHTPGAMGSPFTEQGSQTLECRRCGLRHEIGAADMQAAFDAILLAPEEVQRAIGRKLNLYRLIRSRTA